MPPPIRQGNKWLFDDGTVLPVVSGGSDDLDLPTGIPSLETDSQTELSDFAQGILKDIPEEDRPIVSKYLPVWDGNVTKKFQEYSNKLKPYEQFGSPDELEEVIQFIGLMNEDPLRFYQSVESTLREHGMLPNNDGPVGSNLPEFEGIPDEFVQRYSKLESELSELKGWRESTEAERQQQEQIKQVDNLLKEMHTKHGDFDEEYILAKLVNGADPDTAIKAWQKTIEKYGSPSRKPAPNIIGGAGNVPNGQVDLSKMGRQEKLKYAAERLQQALGS